MQTQDWPSPQCPNFWQYFPDLREEEAAQDLAGAEIARRAARLLRRRVQRVAHWFGISDPHSIDDVCQDVVLKMGRGLAARWSAACGTARSYLDGVIRMTIREHLRVRSTRQAESISAESSIRDLADARMTSPPNAVSLREWLERLRRWFERLARPQREALLRVTGPLFGHPAPLGPARANDYVVKHRLIARLRDAWRGHDAP
jgi:DNA-directed RNA polymerase specialized sigma24 family protein